jgi:hypothetical protein
MNGIFLINEIPPPIKKQNKKRVAPVSYNNATELFQSEIHCK